MMDDRYTRQEILHWVGEQGQRKLSGSRVLVVGAGGLGCPALLYLAGAGVGTIGICDGDRVDLTNLHRQVLYTEESIGRNKAIEAARLLAEHNSQIHYEVNDQFISNLELGFLVRDWDVMIDATDRIETRYLLDDVCRLLNVPLIHASVSGDEIQVALFDSITDDPAERICYRDLYPHAPEANTVSTCFQDGILGTVPAIAGMIQARECLGVLLGTDCELRGKLLWMDTSRYQQRIISIQAKKNGFPERPSSLEDIFRYDYSSLCLSVNAKQVADNSWIQALRLGALLVDLREPHETIVVFCQSGSRGEQAARHLRDRWPNKRIFNVPGGINVLIETISTIKSEPK